jgi:hypothetical protein
MCEVLLVGLVTVGDREHDVGGARNTAGVTYLWRAPCSAPGGRRTLLHQEARPRPIADTDGVTAAAHHAARTETALHPSEEVLPNTVATRDVGTDVGNLILYQSALASHAKRDEQVRTLGGLVARLVG